MPPLLAHHAGEESLAALLLLLGTGSFSVVVAIGRAHLAVARAKLTRTPSSGNAPQPFRAGWTRSRVGARRRSRPV
jgi:hypothetical protein